VWIFAILMFLVIRMFNVASPDRETADWLATYFYSTEFADLLTVSCVVCRAAAWRRLVNDVIAELADPLCTRWTSPRVFDDLC
jgi:hypothetical protein